MNELGHYTTVSRRLKELVKLKIVERKVIAEYPPKVTYCLTESGEKLVEILREIEELSPSLGRLVYTGRY
ncbi:MAG: winged helix-turn-helix transcriptional regulator [Candidatus Hydrothermarchaeales archaeon]